MMNRATRSFQTADRRALADHRREIPSDADAGQIRAAIYLACIILCY